MANLPKVMIRDTLPPLSDASTVNVPGNKRWIVTNIVLANDGGTTIAVTVELTGVALVPTVPLEPGAVFTLDCAQVLEPGEDIFAYATDGGVGAHISGVESDA